jgi:hypothetical protein
LCPPSTPSESKRAIHKFTSRRFKTPTAAVWFVSKKKNS